jgi:hypothetical protein
MLSVPIKNHLEMLYFFHIQFNKKQKQKIERKKI